MKLLYTILIFIGLKLYELISFFTIRPVIFLIKQWKNIVGGLVAILMASISFLTLFWFNHKVFELESGLSIIMILVELVAFIVGAILVYMVRPSTINFIKKNWKKANKISGRK